MGRLLQLCCRLAAQLKTFDEALSHSGLSSAGPGPGSLLLRSSQQQSSRRTMSTAQPLRGKKRLSPAEIGMYAVCTAPTGTPWQGPPSIPSLLLAGFGVHRNDRMFVCGSAPVQAVLPGKKGPRA